jgi:hypothetical protein
LQEYKRQSLNILGVIHHHLAIKAMSANERTKVNPRVVLFAGKAPPGYRMAKLLIRLIVNVGEVINADPDVKGLLTVLFLPDYSVSCMTSSFISYHAYLLTFLFFQWPRFCFPHPTSLSIYPLLGQKPLGHRT